MKSLAELYKIAQFVLIIVLVVIGGLHATKVVLSLADAYGAIDDPCNACEVRTIKTCSVEDYNDNTFCQDGDCIEINLSEELNNYGGNK